MRKGRFNIYYTCLELSLGRTLLHTVYSLLNISCISAPALSQFPRQDVPQERFVSIEISQKEPLKYLDIFAYRSEGMRELLLHERVMANMLPYCRFPLADSTLIDIITISNAPGEFSPALLSMESAIEGLTLPFHLEDPLAPVCSAIGQLSMVEELIGLTNRSLRSVITLRSVSNSLPGNSVLESPRVRLTEIPTDAAVLRWSGFNCATVTTGEWQALPCDIGFLTQYPQTRLYCYPSDGRQEGGGTRWPQLEMEFEVRGSDGQLHTYSCKRKIGPVGRADEIFLDIEITSPSSRSEGISERQASASSGEEEPYSLRILRSECCGNPQE